MRDASATLDGLVDSFKRAWSASPDADPRPFLPAPDDPLFPDALLAFARADLEMSWRANTPRPLDDYRTRFPQLFADPDGLCELAFLEYQLRCQSGQAPSPDEYASRYQIRTDDWPRFAEAGPSIRLEQPSRLVAACLFQTPVGLPESWVPPSDLPAGAIPLPQNLCPAEPADRSNPMAALWPEAGGCFLGFELISELGRGAFGRVFLARQPALAGRLVALKVSVADVVDESQALAQLQHTNIVPVYSVHRSGPLQAVCMPYRGAATAADLVGALRRSEESARGALLEVIRARPRPHDAPQTDAFAPASEAGLGRARHCDAVLWIGARLADGLTHAHDRGILHRDIKPANILLADDGTPMLLDFNVAEDTKRRGLDEEVLGGTLAYMAPEQLAGLCGERTPLDGRADIYSLGLVLFELMTGWFPFAPVWRAAGGRRDLLVRHLLEDRRANLPCPRRLAPDISPAAASIVRHCLEPDPARRYASAAELREDIERHLRDEPLRHAPNPSLGERARKWLRRHPRALARAGAAAAVLSLLLACALGWSALRLHRAGEARRERALFREDYHLGQFLLNTRPPTGDHRRRGEEACRRALDRYGVLDGPGWRKGWRVLSLPAGEQGRTQAEVGELLLLLARTTAQDGDALPEALALHDEAARCFGPEQPLALRKQRAWLLARSGNARQAEALHREVEGLTPASAQDRWLLARELTAESRFREAKELLEPAVREAPDDFWAWFLLGVCCDGLGQDARAVTAYSVCIALEPDFHGPYHNRGLAHLRQKRPAEACADFDRAVALAPDQAEVYLDRALARAGRGETEGALADLNEALARGIPLTRVHFLRARVRAQLGDRAGAEKDRAAGLALTPTDESSWIARGIARMTSQPAGALQDFAEALKLNPRSRAALMNRAHVLAEKLGRQQEAKEALDRVLEAYPDHAPALAGQAVVLARLRQRDLAHERIAQALQRDTGGEVRYQAACAFALTSKRVAADADVAITHLRQALDAGFGLAFVESDPDLEELRGGRGAVKEAFKKAVAAARELRRTR